MCSLTTNATGDEQLSQLQRSGQRRSLEDKLKRWAKEANRETKGYLDDESHHLKNMPDDLQEMRRVRVGRHRVFYSGRHVACAYHVFFIKTFKKTGVDDENDKVFQKRLAKALSSTVETVLLDDEPEPTPED